jgi:hypothetical protein
MSLVDAHIHLTDEEFLQYIGSIITNLKAMKIKVNYNEPESNENKGMFRLCG